MRGGKIVHVLSCAGSQGVIPRLQHVCPIALHTSAPEQLLLTGTNLAVVNNRVMARSLGELLCPAEAPELAPHNRQGVKQNHVHKWTKPWQP